MGSPWGVHGQSVGYPSASVGCTPRKGSRTVHGRFTDGPRTVYGLPNGPRTAHGLPTDCPPSVQERRANYPGHGQSSGCECGVLCGINRQSVGCPSASMGCTPRAVQGLSTDCPRTVHELSTDGPWIPHRLSAECPGTPRGLPRSWVVYGG